MVLHIVTEGDAYYGNAETFCQDCRDGRGKLLAKEFHGYDVDCLEVCLVSQLLCIAEEHQAKTGHERVRVYEFRRAIESRQWGW